jgi:hypothetical protein
MGLGSQRHSPAALLPGKRRVTHCTGAWVGASTRLDGCGKSRPHRESIPVPSSQ